MNIIKVYWGSITLITNLMSGMGPVLACSGAYRALAAVYSLVLLVQQVLGRVGHGVQN